jgi:dipeptidyl aminopeptidase/acylaminoacyl peptidase
MRLKPLLWIAVAIVVATELPLNTSAQGADIKADYERAMGVSRQLLGLIVDVAEAPNWIETSGKFWYRKSVKGGNQFVLVDAAATPVTKVAAFDHARLATALGAAARGTYTAVTLPFSTFRYVDAMQAIEVSVTPGGGRGAGRAAGAAPAAGAAAPAAPIYHCTLTTYECTRNAAPAGGGGGGQGRGGRGGGAGAGAGAAAGAAADQLQLRVSPDGKTEAYIENYNIFTRPVAGNATDGLPLSWNGSEGNAYTFRSITWSPDSKKVAAYRVRPGYQRLVTYVQSSPTDQLQPKASTRSYRKPGDDVDLQQPVIFDLIAKKALPIDNTLFPNPYDLSALQWRKDSHALTFEYNQRGHQVLSVIEADAATGKARAVITETSKTFVDYRTASGTLSDSGRRYRYDVADGKEVIWASERDGWCHLYLYDGVTGQVKNQITKGNWLVRSVEKVDEDKRQIWFTASGMYAGKDPYFTHNYRINFDGTGLTTFTTGDGTHMVSWSPDRQYYVDSYSNVDLPPVSQLRRTSDQAVVLELEKADVSALLATGWKAPEVFTSKARDGQTDIWGVIIRPMNFDPTRTYPVLENIYAGPQGSFVPKTFGTQSGMQTLAELGFIVVQVDGMGTGNRSKAFHDVAWKNLADAGFPDRILWHKAVAAKYPYYDITRVGVYGTSAGGQNAAGAMLFHPEFYKAAASSAGCHDNRMDKIWWNEQWMGYPIGPEYAASSNAEHAANLQGKLFLLVGEMDTNVDPSSTMQVVNALIKANKTFDLLVIPGADHTNGGAYGDHKRFDFFVHNLRGLEPPSWESLKAVPAAAPGGDLDVSVIDEQASPWVRSEDWGR